MKNRQDTRGPKGAELRRKAEERLYGQGAGGSPEAFHETQRLLYELQVHQIELELQNAEITRARDEQEALLERYADLYDFAPVGYFTLDRSGAIVSANLSGADLLGVERDRLSGQRLALYFPDKARPLLCDFLEKVHTQQEKVLVALPLAAPGNPPRFVRLEAAAAQSGASCRVAAIDITEQRLAEEKLIRLNTELERRVAERTREVEASYAALEASYRELEVFSYAVAHDLRTPLRSMNAFSNILLDDHAAQLDEDGQAILRRIGAAAGRMGQLVDGILRLAGLTRLKLTKSTVDLGALACEIVGELREREPGRTVDSLHAEGVTVRGDPHLLRLVLENLLDNAWKYTGTCTTAKIEFGTSRLDGQTVYFVRDNGVGFDMRHTAKLFTPFERLHGAHEFEGIGIGLATVQRIVARHNGRIWAEAEPGKGACFYFTLNQNAGEVTLDVKGHEQTRWHPTRRAAPKGRRAPGAPAPGPRSTAAGVGNPAPSLRAKGPPDGTGAAE